MRRTAIAIVCLAVVVIAAAAYFTWRHSFNATGPSAGAEPSLVSQLPPDALFVFYADVATLRKAEFLAKLAALVPAPAEDPEYAEFVRNTGFDYSRDLDQVAVSLAPATTQPLVHVEAKGRFDQKKIASRAIASGISEPYGRPLYTFHSGTPGIFIDVDFVAVDHLELSNGTRGPQAAENATHKASDAEIAKMRSHVARVSGSPLFAVVRTDSVPKDLTIGTLRMDAIAGTIQNVHWLSLAVTPEGENLRVILEGECGSTIESTQLQLVLESLRMLGRGLLSDPGTRRQFTPQGVAALDKLARQIDISRDGPRVRVTAVLSPDMLTGLAAPSPNPAPNPAPAPKRTPAGH